MTKNSDTLEDQAKAGPRPEGGVQDITQPDASVQDATQGTKSRHADIFKFIGLIAFFCIMGLVVFLLWPYITDLFVPGGRDRVLDEVRNAGAGGVFILLGLQFFQIVVAFIPGEVTQVAAGLLYGPWLGSLIILIGCVLSSAFVFALVHKLGAPFVQGLVPIKYLEKFRGFEKTNKLNIIVFVLFLIPGLPKDVFTYLVPLTDMRMRDFLLLSNIARIPGIIVSTYAANGLLEGRIGESAVIFAIAAAIALAGVLFREKIMNALEKVSGHMKKAKEHAKPLPADEAGKADPSDSADNTDR